MDQSSDSLLRLMPGSIRYNSEILSEIRDFMGAIPEGVQLEVCTEGDNTILHVAGRNDIVLHERAVWTLRFEGLLPWPEADDKTPVASISEIKAWLESAWPALNHQGDAPHQAL